MDSVSASHSRDQSCRIQLCSMGIAKVHGLPYGLESSVRPRPPPPRIRSSPSLWRWRAAAEALKQEKQLPLAWRLSHLRRQRFSQARVPAASCSRTCYRRPSSCFSSLEKVKVLPPLNQSVSKRSHTEVEACSLRMFGLQSLCSRREIKSEARPSADCCMASKEESADRQLIRQMKKEAAQGGDDMRLSSLQASKIHMQNDWPVMHCSEGSEAMLSALISSSASLASITPPVSISEVLAEVVAEVVHESSEDGASTVCDSAMETYSQQSTYAGPLQDGAEVRSSCSLCNHCFCPGCLEGEACVSDKIQSNDAHLKPGSLQESLELITEQSLQCPEQDHHQGFEFLLDIDSPDLHLQQKGVSTGLVTVCLAESQQLSAGSPKPNDVHCKVQCTKDICAATPSFHTPDLMFEVPDSLFQMEPVHSPLTTHACSQSFCQPVPSRMPEDDLATESQASHQPLQHNSRPSVLDTLVSTCFVESADHAITIRREMRCAPAQNSEDAALVSLLSEDTEALQRSTESSRENMTRTVLKPVASVDLQSFEQVSSLLDLAHKIPTEEAPLNAGQGEDVAGPTDITHTMPADSFAQPKLQELHLQAAQSVLPETSSNEFTTLRVAASSHLVNHACEAIPVFRHAGSLPELIVQPVICNPDKPFEPLPSSVPVLDLKTEFASSHEAQHDSTPSHLADTLVSTCLAAELAHHFNTHSKDMKSVATQGPTLEDTTLVASVHPIEPLNKDTGELRIPEMNCSENIPSSESVGISFHKSLGTGSFDPFHMLPVGEVDSVDLFEGKQLAGHPNTAKKRTQQKPSLHSSPRGDGHECTALPFAAQSRESVLDVTISLASNMPDPFKLFNEDIKTFQNPSTSYTKENAEIPVNNCQDTFTLVQVGEEANFLVASSLSLPVERLTSSGVSRSDQYTGLPDESNDLVSASPVAAEWTSKEAHFVGFHTTRELKCLREADPHEKVPGTIQSCIEAAKYLCSKSPSICRRGMSVHCRSSLEPVVEEQIVSEHCFDIADFQLKCTTKDISLDVISNPLFSLNVEAREALSEQCIKQYNSASLSTDITADTNTGNMHLQNLRSYKRMDIPMMSGFGYAKILEESRNNIPAEQVRVEDKHDVSTQREVVLVGLTVSASDSKGEASMLMQSPSDSSLAVLSSPLQTEGNHILELKTHFWHPVPDTSPEEGARTSTAHQFLQSSEPRNMHALEGTCRSSRITESGLAVVEQDLGCSCTQGHEDTPLESSLVDKQQVFDWPQLEGVQAGDSQVLNLLEHSAEINPASSLPFQSEHTLGLQQPKLSSFCASQMVLVDDMGSPHGVPQVKEGSFNLQSDQLTRQNDYHPSSANSCSKVAWMELALQQRDPEHHILQQCYPSLGETKQSRRPPHVKLEDREPESLQTCSKFQPQAESLCLSAGHSDEPQCQLGEIVLKEAGDRGKQNGMPGFEQVHFQSEACRISQVPEHILQRTLMRTATESFRNDESDLWPGRRLPSQQIMQAEAESLQEEEEAKDIDLSALHLAARRGSLQELTNLLNMRADANSRRTCAGVTPLHVAVHSRCSAVVKALIEAGSSVNSTCHQGGLTALHEASQAGCTASVDLLLQARADPGHATFDGATAIHSAARAGHASVMKLLLKSGEDLHDVRDQNGFTPMHDAAFVGNSEVVEELLCTRASHLAVSNGGVTPLHLAAQGGHQRVVELLLEASAQTELHYPESGIPSPLKLAARRGHWNVVYLLMKASQPPK